MPEAVRIITQDEAQSQNVDVGKNVHSSPGRLTENQGKSSNRVSLLSKSRSAGAVFDGNLTSAEAQQVRSQPLTLSDLEDPDIYAATATIDFLAKEDPTFSEKNGSIIDYVKRKKQINMISGSSSTDEGSTQKKQQILEELHVSRLRIISFTFSLNTLLYRESIVNSMGNNNLTIIFCCLNTVFLKNNVRLRQIQHCRIL